MHKYLVYILLHKKNVKILDIKPVRFFKIIRTLDFQYIEELI